MVAITEEKLGKYFGKAFKEVVLPVLKDMDKRLTGVEGNMATKKDLEQFKNDLGLRIDGVESNLANLETKVDRGFKSINERADKIGKSLAHLEDDAPTRNEFGKLEERVK